MERDHDERVTTAINSAITEYRSAEAAYRMQAFISTLKKLGFTVVADNLHRNHDERVKELLVANNLQVQLRRDAEAAYIKQLAELKEWRKMQPQLDELSSLLGVCEGVNPLSVAISFIKHMKRDIEERNKANPTSHSLIAAHHNTDQGPSSPSSAPENSDQQ